MKRLIMLAACLLADVAPVCAVQYLPFTPAAGAQSYYVPCQGIDDTANIRAAIASSFNSIVLGGSCLVTGTLTPAPNSVIQGLDPSTTVRLVSTSVSRIFDLANLNNVTIANVTLNGAQAAAGGDFIRLQNTTNSTLNNVDLVSPPANVNGSIDLSQASTGNVISGSQILSSAGAAIALNGTGVKNNQIVGVYFNGSFGFNIHMYGGPSRNLIQGTYSSQSGIESIALDYSTFENRIIGNHAEGSGDNGISISGYRNVVSGNEVIGNQKAGIYVWGSQNTITGNVGIDNDLINDASHWPCIGTNGNFGGTGQNNTITGNSCDDDQASATQYGITIGAPGYTSWAQGQIITAGKYEVNGLNIYQATNSGTTGATPPTCTSGTCGDGAVTWQYLNSYIGSVATTGTALSGNTIQRFQGAVAYNYSNYIWDNYGVGSITTVFGAGTPASVLTAPIGTLYMRSDGGASTTLYVKESGTGNTGWTAK